MRGVYKKEEEREIPQSWDGVPAGTYAEIAGNREGVSGDKGPSFKTVSRREKKKKKNGNLNKAIAPNEHAMAEWGAQGEGQDR